MDKIQVSKETYELISGKVKKLTRIVSKPYCCEACENGKMTSEIELRSFQADLDRFEIKEGV